MAKNYTGANRFRSLFLPNNNLDIDFQIINKQIVDINILGNSLGTIEVSSQNNLLYYAGGSGTRIYDDFSVIFIIDEEWIVLKEILKWMDLIENPENALQNPQLTTEFMIEFLSNKMNNQFSVIYEKVFPYAMDGISLSSRVDGKQKLELSITFKALKFSLKE